MPLRLTPQVRFTTPLLPRGEGAAGSLSVVHNPRGRPELWLTTPDRRIFIPDAGLFDPRGAAAESASRRALFELFGVGVPNTETVAVDNGRGGVDWFDIRNPAELNRAIRAETIRHEVSDWKGTRGGPAALANLQIRQTPNPEVGASIGRMQDELQSAFAEALFNTFPVDAPNMKWSWLLPSATSSAQREANFHSIALRARGELGDEFVVRLVVNKQSDEWTARAVVSHSAFGMYTEGATLEFRGKDLKEVEEQLVAAVQSGEVRERIETSVETLAQQDPRAALSKSALANARARSSTIAGANETALLRESARPLADGVEAAFRRASASLFAEFPHTTSAADNALSRRISVQELPSEYACVVRVGTTPQFGGSGERKLLLTLDVDLSRGRFGETLKAPPVHAQGRTPRELLTSLLKVELARKKTTIAHLGRLLRAGPAKSQEIADEAEARVGLQTRELDPTSAARANLDGRRGLFADFERQILAEDLEDFAQRKHTLVSWLETQLGLEPGALNARVAELEHAEASLDGASNAQWRGLLAVFEREVLADDIAKLNQQVAKLEALAGDELKQATLDSNLVPFIRGELERLRAAPVGLDGGPSHAASST